MACSSDLVKITGMRRVDDGEPITKPKNPFDGGRPIDPIDNTPDPQPVEPVPQIVICFISISLPPAVQVALSKGCDQIILVP
jgi:hypothetical protein